MWGAATLVAVAASCSSLPDIAPNTCGNGVTEPDHDEDCDDVTVDDAGKQTCYPAGTVGACHFDCSTAACPTGFSCGRDAVCRKPKGVFTEVGRPTQVSADRLFAGDFDEDGLGDVVAQTDVQMSVLYGDRSGSLGAPFVVRAEGNPAIGQHALRMNPAVGQLALDPDKDSSEASDDLVFSKSNGVTTWRGRSDRTLIPTPYSSFGIGPAQPALVVARILDLTDDVLLVLDAHLISSLPVKFDGTLIVRVRSNVLDDTQFLGKFDGKTPAMLAGDPYVGQLDEAASSPCQEIVLAFGEDTSVSLSFTCRDAKTVNTFQTDSLKTGDFSELKPPTTITLGGGAKVRPNGVGVIGGDVNGDGHVDLVIDAEAAGSGNPQTTLVAYGVGDGTFSSSPSLTPVDDVALPLALPFATTDGPVLAVGQLTAKTDSLPDFVFPDKIVLAALDGTGSADAGGTVVVPPPSFFADQPWNEATIADVDGDGSLDVVAGGLNRVDVYKGTGTALATHVPFVVEGDVGDFSVSDFDGDHVLDIAFRATHPQVNQTTTATSDLDVMWGNLFGVPNEPRFIGQFSKIIGSQHGLTTGDIGNNDAISDLGVVTQT
ncbi:MAG TPA: VCBS repeat-containing protein, partial [Polyangiaceae bacterium]